MKALFITTTEPSRSLVQRQGVTRRMKLFMDALGSLATELHLAHFTPPTWVDSERSTLEELQSEFWGMPLHLSLIPRGTRSETVSNHYVKGLLRSYDQPLIYSFAGPEQAEAVGRLLDQDFDMIFVHRLPAMIAVLRSGRRPANVFFDLDDVEHLVRLRYVTQRPFWLGKMAYAAQVPALFVAEKQGIALARQTFVCSARDQWALDRWCGPGKVAIVPNALPLPLALTNPASRPALLFLGACDYAPNAEAAERLATRIFPLVRAVYPEATLMIAGKDSDKLPSSKMQLTNVTYLGFVPDLGDLYANTRVVCCPILNGGGTRVKLIEAASYGRPMISTRIGAEGLEFEDGREILLRDDDESFAGACVHLLRDSQACIELGLAARARMQNLYDAHVVTERVRNLLINHLESDERLGIV